MIYFINQENNSYYNLAIEEVFLKSDIKQNILLLWQNSSTVVIGRNQNAYEEIKISKINHDNVAMVRRQSGGGAVFQDLGNLCYSFIVNANEGQSYRAMCAPIIKTLNRLGVKAEFFGKNDIKVGGKKISGTAQYLYKNRLLHHGTLLFDVDLERITEYLTEDSAKLVSKGIKSIRSQVTNIRNLFTDPEMSIPKLKKEIMNDLADEQIIIKETPVEFVAKAHALVDKKYNTWGWKYGVFPVFDYSNKKRFTDAGSIEVFLTVNHGLITGIKFYGDFVGSAGTDKIETKLQGMKYNQKELEGAITTEDVCVVFGPKFSANDIINLVLNVRNK